MGGGHHHHHPDHSARGAGDARRLWVALALTVVYTVVEVVGGLLAGSLALLADAAHMLSDNAGLVLAIVALWLARRPVTAQRSFGLMRAEILAALVNGVALVAVSIWVFVAAAGRVGDPPRVHGGWVLVVAVVGAAVNVAAGLVLAGGRARGQRSLNLEAALRHVLADLLGSVGVIVSAVLVITLGWNLADPIVGIAIGALVLVSAWGVLRDSVAVLLEAAPRGMDVAAMGTRMAAVPGVREVHDLHVWTITSGFPALSAHVLVHEDADPRDRRRAIEAVLRDELGIFHTTLQVERGRDGTTFVPLERLGDEDAGPDPHPGRHRT